jgi:hypothetical protein
VNGAGGAGVACVSDPNNLINANAWNCDLTNPIMIQGAVYPYGDGSSCPFGPTSPPTNICTTGNCCLSGTTVVDATNAKWGCGIGLELNSSGGTPAVKSVYAGPVKCFDITISGSSGGNVVRIGFTQGSDTTNKVSPFTEIASFTNGWTGEVCFTNAECPSWATAAQCAKPPGTTGTPYDLQIQVSAGADATHVGAYNLCVTSIVPVTNPVVGGTTTSCSSVTGQGSISDQFGLAHVGCNGKDYIVQNNDWGVSSASETINYGPGTKMNVTVQGGTGANGAPASYPSIYTGFWSNNATRTTANSGLPRAVSAITSAAAGSAIKTSWTWAANGATGSYNAAYDVWFSTTSAGDPGAVPSGGFLMVWYHKPTANQPVGTSIGSATIASIPGKTWSVWYGTNSSNGKPVVSYVAQSDITSLSYSLGDFIADAVTRNCVGTTKCLSSSWYLTNVYAGFEIWSGGVGLATTDFAVTVP